jgi:cell division septation protein DedD
MSTSQCATDPDLADPQADRAQEDPQGASRPRKSVLVGFAATITVGLALGSWYVGVRIVAANEAAPVSTALNAPAKVSAASVTPALEPPVPATPSKKEEIAPAPPPPDLYLQVAGLGPRQDASFMKGLAAKGYRAHIIESAANQGVNHEDTQILIGPFIGRRSLEKAERKLQSAGVLAIEVTY